MAWLIKSRPLALVLPVSASPIGIVPASLEPCLRALGILTDIQTYRGFEAEAARAIADVVQRSGLAAARIGMEFGHEQRIGLPPEEVDALRRALPRSVGEISQPEAFEVLRRECRFFHPHRR